ncbi:biotin--[acetyl-CoA-carboxylase] ligase [Microbacterium sp. NPDC089987]|uniref:biotin--[acetyl-CoA-carboxylase] ligase n=1 Tax=Microbacterium sp. NPDC089987 TaxID=3364202 RepID=UPI0038129AAF
MQLSRTRALADPLIVLESCGSTNAEMRERLHGERLGHLAVIVTDAQTAGRGRLDRTWTTPAGSALAVSVLLRDLPADPDAWGWLPLAAGVAMADAVAAQLPAHEVGLKWPNDVLVDGRKICGILAEVTPHGVIIGSGVNTAMTSEQLPVSTATSFAALGAAADIDRLLSDYLIGLRDLVAELARRGAAASGLHREAEKRCLSLGRDVEVTMPHGATLRGRAVGLQADGCLMVDVDGVERAVASGDVVHARLA